MKIGIDARGLNNGERTGKEMYARDLIQALGRVDSKNEYILYLAPGGHDKFAGQAEEREIRWPSFFWHLAVWSRARFRDRVEVFFSPLSYIVPAIFRGSVIVVPDLVSFLGVERHKRKARWIERLLLGRALRLASKVVVISEHTKRDLQKVFKAPTDKIVVIYPGLRIDFGQKLKEMDKEAVLKKFGLEAGKFFLWVSTIEPRKNLQGVLKAVKMLKDQGERVKLAAAGKKGWYWEEEFEGRKRWGLVDEVKYLGYVGGSEIEVLYKNCLGYVFPTLYEGFGLTVLEAMACRAPVLTSKVSSIPEVAGKAAIYVDPNNVEEIAAGMKRLAVDEGLRKKLVQAGREQVKKFDWQRSAKILENVLEKAA